MRDHVLGIDDLDIVIGLDVGCGHRAFTRLGELQHHMIAVVQLQHDALEIEQNIELRARGLSADDADHADGHECGALLPFRIRPARDDE